MRILTISDTHENHRFLKVPEGIDMLLFAGDAANAANPVSNLEPMRDFLQWMSDLPIKHKVIIGGNHDSSIAKGWITPLDMANFHIHYLEHQTIEIEGIKIFGSPYTPTFSTGWYWNVKRGKLAEKWAQIPDDTNILITHGMPKGYGDLTDDYQSGKIAQVGDKSLLNRIDELKDLKLIVGGHIHDGHTKRGSFNNSGIYTRGDKLIVNASCVTDRVPGLSSHGQIINYSNEGITIEI